MKNGWKRWIRGWSLIVILLSVLSVSGCSVSEEDGLQEVTEKVSQEPEVSQKDSGKSEDQEKPGQTEGDTDTGSKKSAEKKIWVYVCGAVNAPGVYELKEDARLYEAIELAGGVNQEAAPEVLNQARVLADGERIYVPKQDEAESYSLQDQGLESNAGTADTRGKININTAGKEELMTLPGIGEAKAEKILRYREQLGGFHSTRQLKEIKFQHLNIDSLLSCFSANPALIKKKDLDTMSFKSVLHHPYLVYEDVQLIFNAKRKFGKINYSILESQKILPLFKLKKIKPYFK